LSHLEILEILDPLQELFHDPIAIKVKVLAIIIVLKKAIVTIVQIIPTAITDLLLNHIILQAVVPRPREGVLVPLEVQVEVVLIKK
jgi:hypothetical protein